MTGPLWERGDVHALLVAETERARSGHGGLVLLRGATGTGRSAVLEAAAAHAAHRGLRVLRVRCSPEDTAVPFSTILHLLGPVPEFADMAPGGDDRGSAARLWRLLRSYAAEGPLMLAVDDVHLADEPSRRWLVEAVRRVDPLPVLAVATERRQYDIDPRPAGLTHALSPSLVRAHTLAPLTDEASADLVRAAFPAASPSWTADCVRAGAGNPLLLRALLDDLAGAPAGAVPRTCAALYPGSYPAAVSWWLDGTGPATAQVARMLAVLEQAGEQDREDERQQAREQARQQAWAEDSLAGLLAEASGADAARVSGWLTAMTRIGVLRPDAEGRPAYAHPLLRDAVLTGWSAVRRQAAHRALAAAMLRRGDGVAAVARQLLGSGTVGLPWALRVLRDAAAVAVRESRTEDAVGLLRRALQEPLRDDLKQRTLTVLGSLEYATADAPAGIPRLAEAMCLPAEPRDQVRTALALGAALAGRGEVRAAVDLLRRVEDRLGEHPEPAATLRAAAVLLSDRDQTVRREAYARLHDTAERSPELVDATSRALLVRYAATAGTTSARAAMTRMRELLTEPGDPLAEPFLLGTAAAVAQWADELDEAERLAERALAGQRPELLHPMDEALLDTWADIAAARAEYGRLLADHAERTVPADRTGPSNIDAHALIALVETGRTDEARRLADGFDLRNAPDSWELNRLLYARGVLRSAEGDTTGALHDFLECGRRQSARDVISPVVTPWRTAAAECRLALGSPREALALAGEELRLARVWNTPRAVGRALRVLGLATGGRRGLELAEAAVGVLRTAPDGVELVTALIAQGRQLTAAGERARGRECLREAAERAERLGAVRLRTDAEEALRAGGARRSGTAHTGSGALTGSERRIAELAADGRTNTEIADLLHVARRTVETHLTSTYRKLGIRRRGELRGALGVVDEGEQGVPA
ncbi:AAA family ATPase [Streptomyces olivochromogenes]|uniref:AAA family ATPase n=1 Tax=Streptomyces olivochromogenes TaxID=1963 RepID=UPI001F175B26|nr:AAA family ATPase [Streptomyces olivochromogenes]MCF3133978.1 helix-turn-helix transcriptional regulator [Streptomyces olivochromogenes]